MLAEQRLPRGTSDVQGLSDVNMYQQYHLGITDAIDYSKLKNAKYLIPSMKFEYGIGHIYSGKVGVYNPTIVPTRPEERRVGKECVRPWRSRWSQHNEKKKKRDPV